MNADTNDRQSRRLGWSAELVSWVLFLFSAVFFVISALRSGDVPGLIGALLFLLACTVFLLPFVVRVLGVTDSNKSRSS